MKKNEESSPEFTLSFTHCGISVSISAKLVAEDYLTTAESGQENESHLGRALSNALPEAARLAGESLQQFHAAFEQVVHQSVAGDFREKILPLIDMRNKVMQAGLRVVNDEYKGAPDTD